MHARLVRVDPERLAPGGDRPPDVPSRPQDAGEEEMRLDGVGIEGGGEPGVPRRLFRPSVERPHPGDRGVPSRGSGPPAFGFEERLDLAARHDAPDEEDLGERQPGLGIAGIDRKGRVLDAVAKKSGEMVG
mgnify:CR=1 FL=1